MVCFRMIYIRNSLNYKILKYVVYIILSHNTCNIKFHANHFCTLRHITQINYFIILQVLKMLDWHGSAGSRVLRSRIFGFIFCCFHRSFIGIMQAAVATIDNNMTIYKLNLMSYI
ncbi:hypothetical protein CAJAP_09262 [Camponotus japonicus]